MLKYIFAFILFVHGLIHFIGFAKAYGYGSITQLTKYISKTDGSLWFFAAILFVVATVLFLLKNESWPYIAITAVVISQILIISNWGDAKFGSIANTIILLVAIATWGSQHYESTFRNDVKLHLLEASTIQADLLKSHTSRKIMSNQE